MKMILLAAAICLLPQEGMREATRSTPMAPYFNGKDLTGWKVDENVKKHWSIKDGKIVGNGDGVHLWTDRDFGNFAITIDYRLTSKVERRRRPIVLPNGELEKDDDGTLITRTVNDAGESGIFLRGSEKAKIDIWCWMVGSGGIEHYRNDEKLPAETRAKCVPMQKADKKPGEKNSLMITVYKEWVSVDLNGTVVISKAHLPGLPEKGPVGIRLAGYPIEIEQVTYTEKIDGESRS